MEDNPLLEKYYEDPNKYAFDLQIFFLNRRFRLIKDAFEEDNNVLDRSIYEDELFTYVNHLQGQISKEQLDIYSDLVDNMMEELDSLPKKAPDLMIYLDTSFEHVMANIEKRGRPYEQIGEDTTEHKEREAYYKLLHSEYDNWIANYDKSPVLVIDADKYDVNKPEDWEIVLGIILDKMEEVGICDIR